MAGRASAGGGWLQSVLPPDLPRQLEAVSGILAEIRADLRRLVEATGAAQIRPVNPEPRYLSLPLSSTTPINVIGLILGGDAAGTYSIQVGNAVLFDTVLAANSPFFLPLDGERRLAITQGQDVTLVAPTGAVAVGTAIAVPRASARA